METEIIPHARVWPSELAILIAVFVPLIIWCVVAYRLRQVTWKSVGILGAVELMALIAIAILARF